MKLRKEQNPKMFVIIASAFKVNENIACNVTCGLLR